MISFYYCYLNLFILTMVYTWSSVRSNLLSLIRYGLNLRNIFHLVSTLLLLVQL